MPHVTCHYPGGYSGLLEPGGNPRLRLDLAEGQTAEVSPAKAEQLLRDFPGYFTTDQRPAPRAAQVTTEPADVPAEEPPADEAPAADETTEAAPRRRATTRRK